MGALIYQTGQSNDFNLALVGLLIATLAVVGGLVLGFGRSTPAAATPDVIKRMGELAITPIQSTPDEATKYFNSQLAFWDPIVKASGAKPE